MPILHLRRGRRRVTYGSSAPAAVTATGRRGPALVVLCLVQFMLVLDDNVVSVALPSIRDDLGFTTAGLAWVVNAYFLAFGGLLLLFGRMADLWGRRRVFLIGVALFGAASLLCGLAREPWQLVGGRFVQGAGAAVRLDLPGAVLGTGALVSLVYGLLQTESGWGRPAAAGPLLLAAALAFAFVTVEARSAEPLVPLSFLSFRVRAVTNGATLLFSAAFYAMAFLLMVHLQTVLGYRPSRPASPTCPTAPGSSRACGSPPER
ncbi:hypothetical protein GCM10009574_012150 [Streptomyces asiaticus]|uniref:Major facilitator superfamily (MFS) profile domain-containing protein n=2 Tax=Streptomyces rhizosphaericus TaxID=114699 RepID=A0ABN1S971_9ACTN